MRLERLAVDGFKNLNRFEIEFGPDSYTTVLVGQNGTGKSNLLEAIVLIFRALDLYEPAPFSFDLRYTCSGHSVSVRGQAASVQYSIEVDGSTIKLGQLRDSYEHVLPRNIFGYYSGPSGRMESHFEKHQERFYDQLLAGDESATRRLFFARLIHSQFVLLAFFRDQDPIVQDFLRTELSIGGLRSVLFVLKQPPWRSNSGDARFWNARGVVRDFLARLYAKSLAPLRLRVRVPTGLRKTSQVEQLYLYLPDASALRELAAMYADQQAFFSTLESTYVSQLLSSVRIRVQVYTADGDLTFKELSEGEQQLLTVLGLLRFTRSAESLFLLDEPDTHLNPAWSIQYFDLLRKVVGDDPSSHIIMTSHDPLTIAGLTRDSVRIMRREPEGRIVADVPEQDPRGLGVAGLLTSDVFGLYSTLDLATLRLLEEKRELAAKPDVLTDAERERLAWLNAQLTGVDFSNSIRDPLYQRFVHAMTERSGELAASGPVLSAEERGEIDRLALEIVGEITKK